MIDANNTVQAQSVLPSKRRIGAVVRKEWQELLYSPVAYIVIAIYLVITGIFIFFINNFFLSGILDLRTYFGITPYILAFSVSALTMRLLSEERRSGSIEVLGTLPISTIEVVLGKFLALWLFSGLTLLFTLGYPVSFSFLGELDSGAILSGYVGQILLCGAFVAIGLFASSVSRNPISSFFIAFLITLILLFLEFMLRAVPGQFSLFLRNLSAGYHLQNFTNGIIDLRDILYFFSIMFLGVYASWLKLQTLR
ncbi:ABC transporter permease [Candidatus Haliotispira prima]|uniref:ABC transporter permease n=1 Tax=Candidatus Haliotispira prima TaxID=3034016 RepID=A0ABY8MKQ2_9SPIO|nr:ABC transporter permease [Candidatus Haliotispira prima]